MRVLLTGFEPFAGDTENASQVVVEQLARSWSHPGIELATVVLPVEFAGAPRRLDEAIGDLRPDVVISVGEAGRRAIVTPERYADRRAAARIPDNAGDQPSADLDPGPPKLATRLDVDALVEALRAQRIPTEVSEDAGHFVCNALFRHLLRTFDGPAGFVHVPAVRSRGVAGVGDETDSRASAAESAELTFEILGTAIETVVLRAAAG